MRLDNALLGRVSRDTGIRFEGQPADITADRVKGLRQ